MVILDPAGDLPEMLKSMITKYQITAMINATQFVKKTKEEMIRNGGY